MEGNADFATAAHWSGPHRADDFASPARVSHGGSPQVKKDVRAVLSSNALVRYGAKPQVSFVSIWASKT